METIDELITELNEHIAENAKNGVLADSDIGYVDLIFNSAENLDRNDRNAAIIELAKVVAPYSITAAIVGMRRLPLYHYEYGMGELAYHMSKTDMRKGIMLANMIAGTEKRNATLRMIRGENPN